MNVFPTHAGTIRVFPHGADASCEHSLEGSQVVRAVVVVQDREDDFQVPVSELGEILLKALRYRMRALAKCAATPGGQHEVGAPLHGSRVKEEADEPLSIRP